MTTEGLVKIRFTGKLTGLSAITVKGHGTVEKGHVIEVSHDEAERWTEPKPTGDGETASDFALVGGAKDDADDHPAAKTDQVEGKPEKVDAVRLGKGGE